MLGAQAAVSDRAQNFRSEPNAAVVGDASDVRQESELTTRYSFVGEYRIGACLFLHRAVEIESRLEQVGLRGIDTGRSEVEALDIGALQFGAAEISAGGVGVR